MDRGDSMDAARHYDRRAFHRHRGSAIAAVILDNDMMRNPIRGELFDISCNGLGLILPTPLKEGDYLSVGLENPLRRLKFSIRACVQHLEPCEDGQYRIGCALLHRLTPRQVMDLKKSIGHKVSEIKKEKRGAMDDLGEKDSGRN